MSNSADSAPVAGAGLMSVLDTPIIRTGVSVAIIAFVWEFVGAFQIFGRSFPPLSAIAAGLPDVWPLIFRGGQATAWEALVGGLIGFGVGIAMAAMTALLPRSHGPILKTAIIINAVPIIAVGPIMMTLTDRALIPFIFAAFPAMFTTTVTASDGFRSADKSSIDLFRVFGAPRLGLFRRLLLPSALPSFADSLRVSAPSAILGAVLGEWFGAERGLGVIMVSAMRNVQYELLWTAAFATVALSFAATMIAGLAERRVNELYGRPTTALAAVPTLSRLHSTLIGLVAVVLLIGGWQLWIVLGNVPQLVAPTPLQVLVELVTEPWEFIRGAYETVGIAAAGVLIGCVVAVSCALIVSAVPLLRALSAPIVIVIPTIPIVVFIPILGSLLGFNILTVLATCVLMAFFPVFALTLAGLAARPPGSDNLFSVYRANRWQRMMSLALPSAMPALLLSLRIAAAQSFLIALTSEWLLGLSGIGRVISFRRALLDNPGVWAAVAVAIALSVAAYLSAVKLEQWVARRWS